MTAPAPAARDAVLAHWLTQHAAPLKLDANSLAPASADASFRRYFRLRHADGGSRILMDAPPGLEDPRPFMAVAERFARCGVHVPSIDYADLDVGILILEDFGATDFLRALDATTAPTLYAAASAALIQLQQGSVPDALPEYDEPLLRRELELFREWYCERHLGLTLTPAQHTALDKAFELLIRAALAQPTVYVHRDYHSRNLMVLRDDLDAPGPGILDFQDAVMGPITYDLVSLLRDAYIDWEEPQVIDWTVRHWERARQAGLPVAADFGEFYRDFEWMGLQRHLKVLGIFARLYHRDGKAGYLKDMPRVLAYARACAQRYSGLAPLAHLLDALAGVSPDVGYTF